MACENWDVELESMIGGVRSLEMRPIASYIDIQEIEPLWSMLNRRGITHSTTAQLIELAFDHGGFIAGGFGRWAATSSRSAMERGEYIASGGDIDLFFRTKEGWVAYLRELAAIDSKEILLSSIGISKGSLAVNFRPKLNKKEHVYNGPPPMQAIGCVVGDPEHMMRSFDFVNCMFAIERDKSWAASDALQLEADHVLGVAAWASRGLVHRLSKYRSKYGYNVCRDMSAGRRVDHLCDAAGRFTDADSGIRSARGWAHLLSWSKDSFFEDPGIATDILSCGIIPFDSAGDLTSSTVKSLHTPDSIDRILRHGTYKLGIETLLAREIKAKSTTAEEYERMMSFVKSQFARHPSLNPEPPTWTAEEYCWSF
jgi:hypothetical protein